MRQVAFRPSHVKPPKLILTRCMVLVVFCSYLRHVCGQLRPMGDQPTPFHGNNSPNPDTMLTSPAWSCDRVADTCVRRPVNHPFAMFTVPNASLTFATADEFLDLDTLAIRYPFVNVTLVTHRQPASFAALVAFLVQYEYGPDLLSIMPGLSLRDHHEHLLDLRPILHEIGVLSVLYPGARNFMPCVDVTDGSIYCLLRDAMPWWMLMSRDIFDARNLSIPQTFQELLNLCRQLRSAEIVPIAMAGNTKYYVTGFFDIMNMRTNGGDFHRLLCTGKISWYDRRVRETFKNWQRLTDARCFNDDPMNTSLYSNDFKKLVKDRKIAMIYTRDDYRFRELVAPRVMDMVSLDVFPFPEITKQVLRGTTVSSDAFVASRTTKQLMPIGLALSYFFPKRSPRQDYDTVVRFSPRSDAIEPNNSFQVKGRIMLNNTDVIDTGFHSNVPPKFLDEAELSMSLWLNGSLTLDKMLQQIETARILFISTAHLPPVASVPSGSYARHVTTSLNVKDFNYTGEREIRFSINDEHLTEVYRQPLRFGPGQWVLRARTIGKSRAQSELMKVTYHVKRTEGSLAPVVLISLASCSLTIGVIVGMCSFLRHYWKMRLARMEQFKSRVNRVRKATIHATELSFPMCIVKYSNFEVHGALLQHEELLNMGQVFFLHTYAEVCHFLQENEVVFISHQWLARCQPDPEHVFYQCTLTAITELCTVNQICTDDVWLWIDYCSIPQKNRAIKLLAIASIRVYASTSSYFIVVAPQARHAETSEVCDAWTYSSRGWCRLEQWARFILGGMSQMYIFQEDLLPLNDMGSTWNQFVNIFSGDFTVNSDKSEIVDVVLGIWAHCMFHADAVPEVIDFFKTHNKEEVFPKAYFGDLMGLLDAELQQLRSQKRHVFFTSTGTTSLRAVSFTRPSEHVTSVQLFESFSRSKGRLCNRSPSYRASRISPSLSMDLRTTIRTTNTSRHTNVTLGKIAMAGVGSQVPIGVGIDESDSSEATVGAICSEPDAVAVLAVNGNDRVENTAFPESSSAPAGCASFASISSI